jgi:prepilin-type processing-associated H-X9-DG protein
LLVVIAIIAILAAILFPVFAKAREKANQTTCMNNQRQIAVAVLMYVQDNDEMFPSASAWYSHMTNQYGITGDAWDCPSTTLVGNPSRPDYFYVAGSFLSGVALGDVAAASDAPLLGDLSAPDVNKPFINDAGTTNLTKALATVGFNHNNSAIFAFVDGHVGLFTKESVTPGFFVPSIVDLSQLTIPVSLGDLYPVGLLTGNPSTQTAPSNGVLKSTLAKYNLSIALGHKGGIMDLSAVAFSDGSTAMPSFVTVATGVASNTTQIPSWIKTGAAGDLGYTQTNVVGTFWGPAGAGSNGYISGFGNVSTNYDFGNLAGVNNGNPGAISTADIILTPNVTAPTAKRIAIVVYQNRDCLCWGRINWIKIGSTQTILNVRTQTNSVSPTASACVGALVPVQPNQKIEINATVGQDGGGHRAGLIVLLEK